MTSSDAGTPEISPPEDTAGDARVPRGESAAPEQSREDTDTGWGEYPEAADDRLYRDRPPHWDDYF
jgi:hypothetical protein